MTGVDVCTTRQRKHDQGESVLVSDGLLMRERDHMGYVAVFCGGPAPGILLSSGVGVLKNFVGAQDSGSEEPRESYWAARVGRDKEQVRVDAKNVSRVATLEASAEKMLAYGQ